MVFIGMFDHRVSLQSYPDELYLYIRIIQCR